MGNNRNSISNIENSLIRYVLSFQVRIADWPILTVW
ncbi:Uncharacterised protein [Vibrio cholerae]|nr:Uncharacterised protein [Vibrio cholerae]CSA77190.1 Uncharacterised protein [Vibrio cholerae]